LAEEKEKAITIKREIKETEVQPIQETEEDKERKIREDRRESIRERERDRVEVPSFLREPDRPIGIGSVIRNNWDILQLIGTTDYEGWVVKVNKPTYKHPKSGKIYPERDLHSETKPSNKLELEETIRKLFGGGKYRILVYDDSGAIHSNFMTEVSGDPIEAEDKLDSGAGDNGGNGKFKTIESDRCQDLEQKIQETHRKKRLVELEKELKELEKDKSNEPNVDDTIKEFMKDVDEQKKIDEKFRAQEEKIIALKADVSKGFEALVAAIANSKESTNTANSQQVMIEAMKQQSNMIAETFKMQSQQASENMRTQIEAMKIQADRDGRSSESLEKVKADMSRVQAESMARSMETMKAMTEMIIASQKDKSESLMKMMTVILDHAADASGKQSWIKDAGEVIKDLASEAVPLIASFAGKSGMPELTGVQNPPQMQPVQSVQPIQPIIVKPPKMLEVVTEEKPGLLNRTETAPQPTMIRKEKTQESKLVVPQVQVQQGVTPQAQVQTSEPAPVAQEQPKQEEVQVVEAPQFSVQEKEMIWHKYTNELLAMMIEDAKIMQNEPNWVEFAITKLPREMLEEIMSFTGKPQVVDFLNKYANPDLIANLVALLKNPAVIKWGISCFAIVKSEFEDIKKEENGEESPDGDEDEGEDSDESESTESEA